jgi:hypothetical protein
MTSQTAQIIQLREKMRSCSTLGEDAARAFTLSTGIQSAEWHLSIYVLEAA